MTVPMGPASIVWSRRKLLRGAAAGGAGAVAAGLIACGTRRQSGSSHTQAEFKSPETAQPKAGGTITRLGLAGTGIFSGGFDVQVLNAAQTGLLGLFYQTLLRQNAHT